MISQACGRPVGILRAALCAAVALSAASMLEAVAQTSTPLFDATRPLQLADQGSFFAIGPYVDMKDGLTVMAGQLFVQFQIPARRTRPYPIVLIHGGGLTGANFLSTPDGRKGWADYFVAHGYAVYVVDQVGRGRSGYFEDSYGRTRKPNVGSTEQRFTYSSRTDWPQAKAHTQWPGSGQKGDTTFDQLFASEVEDMDDLTALEQLNKSAVLKLLDKIGPAILLTHSQSGPIGWLVADANPKLVKALIAVEPSGPPFNNVTAKDFDPAVPLFTADRGGAADRAWGLTRSPMTFDPAASSPSDLRYSKESTRDGLNLVRCELQVEPARKLVNLAGLPILMVMSESSYHTPYDHCTSKFLTQAGVKHEFMRLADKGVRGNGHLMMLEKNNLEIAQLIEAWERSAVR